FARERHRRVAVALDRLRPFAADAERRVNLVLDLLRDRRVGIEVRLRVRAALAEAFLAIGEERARLRDDVVLDAEVEQASRCRDSPAELDVELRLAERRRDLVLDDLHAHAVADRLGPVLESLDAADVQALGGVELQRAAPGLR